MKNYKILNIIPYLDASFGGPPYVARSLHDLFIKNKFKSKILTLGNQNKEKNIIMFKKTANLYFFSLGFLFNYFKYMKHSNIVIIHGLYTFPSLIGTIIASIYRKKIILLPHGMLDKDSVFSSNIFKSTAKALYLYLIFSIQYLCVKKIIFNSEKEMENSFFNKKNNIIPNGIKLDIIQNINPHKKTKTHIKLFFLGRLHPIKGLDLIFKALSEFNTISNVTFEIAGKGDKKYIAYLKQLSRSLHIDHCVKFLGFLEGKKKYQKLKDCDIYLQPSKTEGLSISMLEAMACQCAIITTHASGIAKELNDSNAGIACHYSVPDLYAVLKDLINNPKKRKILGNNALQLIKNKYNWPSILNSYINLFKNL